MIDPQLLGVIGAIISGLLMVLGVLFRYAVSAKERELEYRIGRVELNANNAIDRLHQAELSAARAEGQILLIKKDSDTIRDDVEEIKNRMVGREDWAAEIEKIHNGLDQILRMQSRRTPYDSDTPPKKYLGK